MQRASLFTHGPWNQTFCCIPYGLLHCENSGFSCFTDIMLYTHCFRHLATPLPRYFYTFLYFLRLIKKKCFSLPLKCVLTSQLFSLLFFNSILEFLTSIFRGETMRILIFGLSCLFVIIIGVAE